MGDHGWLPLIMLGMLLTPVVLAVAAAVLLVAAVRWSNRTNRPPTAFPAGWYEDPWQGASLRYWDGMQWTGDTRTPRS
jgi:hypothetical protein